MEDEHGSSASNSKNRHRRRKKNSSSLSVELPLQEEDGTKNDCSVQSSSKEGSATPLTAKIEQHLGIIQPIVDELLNVSVDPSSSNTIRLASAPTLKTPIESRVENTSKIIDPLVQEFINQAIASGNDNKAEREKNCLARQTTAPLENSFNALWQAAASFDSSKNERSSPVSKLPNKLQKKKNQSVGEASPIQIQPLLQELESLAVSSSPKKNKQAKGTATPEAKGAFSTTKKKKSPFTPVKPVVSKTIPPLMEPAVNSSPKNNRRKSSNSVKSGDLKNGPVAGKSIDNTYPPHLDENVIKVLESCGALLTAPLRINNKCSYDAYLAAPDKGPDFIIEGIRDRNRGLDGDVVYAVVKPWQTVKFQAGKSMSPAAVVVGIKEKLHNRICIGSLSPFVKKFTTMVPVDNRLPRLRIDESFLPKEYLKHPMEFQDYLYASSIILWDDVRYAYGGPLKYLGIAGTATAETTAILTKYSLDVTPYPPHFNRCFPGPDFIVPQAELNLREDLRSECVFTIDPETAKDLDDAVSLKRHEDGSCTMGVHISDVTYYLPEGSELDLAISQRATTIYLVDAVYHMLPRDLCSLCSLTPGADKLAFSVFWHFSPDGEIISQRFARTVINSVAQLSYEQAQGILENTPVVLPPLANGFTEADVKERILAMNVIAEKLRAKRVESGALRIDQVKVSFILDPERKTPLAFIPQEQQAAHRLIEEFMLLANTTVAEFIQEKLPELAFLRRHDPPLPEYLARLQAQLERYGVALDITSSKTLQTSLSRLSQDSPSQRAQLMVIYNSLAKPMMRANYFCSKFVELPEEREHYALSVPTYTHFTSPIRRYADIMVHHLLAAALRLRPVPSWTSEYVQSVAATCNTKKYNAKLAGDASIELFFALYVGQQGSVIQEAVVCYVGNNFFEALLLSTGLQIKIFYDKIDGKVTTVKEAEFEATIEWSDGKIQKVDLFSILVVELTRGKGVHLDARLLPELAF